jgi:hypothetical protein
MRTRLVEARVARVVRAAREHDDVCVDRLEAALLRAEVRALDHGSARAAVCHAGEDVLHLQCHAQT